MAVTSPILSHIGGTGIVRVSFQGMDHSITLGTRCLPVIRSQVFETRGLHCTLRLTVNDVRNPASQTRLYPTPNLTTGIRECVAEPIYVTLRSPRCVETSVEFVQHSV